MWEANGFGVAGERLGVSVNRTGFDGGPGAWESGPISSPCRLDLRPALRHQRMQGNHPNLVSF